MVSVYLDFAWRKAKQPPENMKLHEKEEDKKEKFVFLQTEQ